jgi:hypothetical protein
LKVVKVKCRPTSVVSLTDRAASEDQCLAGPAATDESCQILHTYSECIHTTTECIHGLTRLDMTA